MTNLELQNYLKQYPDEMPIKVWRAETLKGEETDLTDELFHVRSTTLYIDDEAPDDEWDTEDGKIELGDGEKYLTIFPHVL